jgi:hypothetical protein
MNLSEISVAQLRRAIVIKEQLEVLEQELAGITGAPVPAVPQKEKGKISAAGLARIRAAQKARWAKVNATAKPAVPAKPKKFTMSAAAKAAISRAAKARWAKLRGVAPTKPVSKVSPAKPAAQKPVPGKPLERGALRAQIIDLVKGAGKAGITFKEIAAKTGRTYKKVSKWFYLTGERVKEIKKVAPAKYAWRGQ